MQGIKYVEIPMKEGNIVLKGERRGRDIPGSYSM